MNAENTIDAEVVANSKNSKDTLVLRLQAYIRLAEQLYVARKNMIPTNNTPAGSDINSNQ